MQIKIIMILTNQMTVRLKALIKAKIMKLLVRYIHI